MIVKNTTKSIIGAAVDHKGAAVVRIVPGWSEIADAQWIPTEVEITDEQEIKGFGKKVVHGIEAVLKGRIESGNIVVLGYVEQKDPKAAKRGKTLKDLPNERAIEIIDDVNDSNLLRGWAKQSASEEIRIAILNRLEDLKPKKQG